MSNKVAGTQEQVDPTDELATLISYYHFYTSSSFTAGSSAEPSSHSPSKTTTDTQVLNDNDYEFWVEDTWTHEDEEQAESVLRKAQNLCDIASNPGSRAKLTRYTTASFKSWDRFYSSHGTNFFHDRHYLPHAFPNEFGDSSQPRVVAEIGCGVGNAILPLLEQDTYTVWGFDFSETAVNLLKKDPRFVQAKGRAFAEVWDITKPPQHKNIPADICMMLFCLSAILPQDMDQAVKNVVGTTLQPGGVLVFRDYGRYDQAQLQLGTSRGKRLGENVYVKHDGTRCYYFDLDDIKRLFCDGAGLKVLELRYIRRVYKNRANNQDRRRVWVQARFQKPNIQAIA